MKRIRLGLGIDPEFRFRYVSDPYYSRKRNSVQSSDLCAQIIFEYVTVAKFLFYNSDSTLRIQKSDKVGIGNETKYKQFLPQAVAIEDVRQRRGA